MTAIRDTAHHEFDITRARDPRQQADHRPAAVLRNQVAQLVIESLESHRAGWEASFDNLDRVLAE
jgi:hypothetical protein